MGTIRWILIALTTSAFAANASAQKVTYDYQHREDFSSIRTFSFKDAPSVDRVASETTTYDSPLVLERTKAAVASQLEARGLRRDDEHPDMYVTVRRTFRSEYVTYASAGWGWEWGYWSYPNGYGFYPYYGGSPWVMEEIVKGTLIVDLTSADGQLIWRGIGERTVDPTVKPEKRTAKISKEVTKIFKNYPSSLGAVATAGHGVPKPR